MRQMRYSAFFVLVLVVLAISPFHHAIAQAPNNLAVIVTGSGPSYYEAKSDAVRKALQYAMKQLVVVDRIVSGNDVLRDRVLSTSNGYVEKYREKSVKETDVGFTVDAEITVSASRIEGFLGIVAGGGGRINGSVLGMEVQRRRAQMAAEQVQAKARGEIFDRLFENYPWSAFDLNLKKVSIKNGNDDMLVLSMEAYYNRTFLRDLRETLEGISESQCTLDNGVRITTNAFPSICVDGPKTEQNEEYDTICIPFTQDKTKCFFLRMNTKISGEGFGSPNLQIKVFGRFVDLGGVSSHKTDDCISARPIELGGVSRVIDWNFHVLNAYRPGFQKLIAYLDVNRIINFQIDVSSSDIRIESSSSFISILGYARDGLFGVGGLDIFTISDVYASDSLGYLNKKVNACRLVDDAVRRYMLAQYHRPSASRRQ